MSEPNAIDPNDPQTTPSVQDAAPTATPSRTRGRAAGFLAVLALLTALAVAGAGAYAYIWILKPLQSTKATLESTQQRLVEEQRSVVDDLRARLDAFNSSLESLRLADQDTLSRVQGFEAQLAQLRGQAHWSRREWVLAEAQYLLQVAEDRLRYMRDVGTAQTAVRSALMRIDQLTDPALGPVRQMLQRDLQILMQYKRPDPVSLLGRLEALVSALQSVPSAGTRQGRDTIDDMRSAQSGAPDDGAGGNGDGWFSRLLQRFGERIHVIHHDSALDALARNTVDQQAYDLLRLRLESLRLTLLQEDAAAYQRELLAMEQWVGAMLDSPAAKPLQGEIRALRETSPFSTLPSLETSIAQLGALLEATSASAPSAPSQTVSP